MEFQILLLVIMIFLAWIFCRAFNKPEDDKKTIDSEPVSNTSPIKLVEGSPVTSNIDNYVVLDFETTGLSSVTDSIIEVGIIKVIHGIEIDSFHSFVNPGRAIPEEIKRLTGITDADVINAPMPHEIASKIYKFIDNLTIIAHNANFDVGFLSEAYKKSDIQTTINYIDTLSMAREAFPHAPNHKLSTLVNWLDIGDGQDHRALSDVKLTKALYEKCSSLVQAKERHLVVKQASLLTDEHMQVALWIKQTLLDAGRNIDLLAFETRSKYFRVSYFYCILDIKLGGKLRYVLITEKYLKLIDNSLLTPCPVSEGSGNMRFPIDSGTDLAPLTPVLLAAYDDTTAQFESVKKYISQLNITRYLSRSIQV